MEHSRPQASVLEDLTLEDAGVLNDALREPATNKDYNQRNAGWLSALTV